VTFRVTGFERSYGLGEPIRLRWQIYNPGRTALTVLAPIKGMREIAAVELQFDVRRPDGSLVSIQSASFRSQVPDEREYVPVTLPPGGRVAGDILFAESVYPEEWMLSSPRADSTALIRIGSNFELARAFPLPGNYEVHVTSSARSWLTPDFDSPLPAWAEEELTAGPYRLRIREP
jgi:hypothetical protein